MTDYFVSCPICGTAVKAMTARKAAKLCGGDRCRNSIKEAARGDRVTTSTRCPRGRTRGSNATRTAAPLKPGRGTAPSARRFRECLVAAGDGPSVGAACLAVTPRPAASTSPRPASAQPGPRGSKVVSASCLLAPRPTCAAQPAHGPAAGTPSRGQAAMTWPPREGPPPQIGALVADWSAFAIDAILRATDDTGRPRGARYAAAMNPQQRAEFEQTCRAIKAAAQAYDTSRASDTGTAEMAPAEIPAPWTHELSAAQAAAALRVSDRHIRHLAAGWAEHGLARKVGRAWLIDREAIRLHQHTMRDSA